MILLDTNALIWIDAGHRRVRPLLRRHERLFVSPATLLELQFLSEIGRIRLKDGDLGWVMADDRWSVDEPVATTWFMRAVQAAWTRDPFDRLIAAHAEIRRWRVATGDAQMIERFGANGIAL